MADPYRVSPSLQATFAKVAKVISQNAGASLQNLRPMVPREALRALEGLRIPFPPDLYDRIARDVATTNRTLARTVLHDLERNAAILESLRPVWSKMGVTGVVPTVVTDAAAGALDGIRTEAPSLADWLERYRPKDSGAMAAWIAVVLAVIGLIVGSGQHQDQDTTVTKIDIDIGNVIIEDTEPPERPAPGRNRDHGARPPRPTSRSLSGDKDDRHQRRQNSGKDRQG